MYAQTPTVWSSDFSSPSEWTSTSEGIPTDAWVIGTDVPAGPFPIAQIASPSAANGFALFDSDLSCSGNQIVNLTMTGNADCSGLDLVELRFYQYYKRFNDSTFVFVSNDNGISWSKFSVNYSLTTNYETNNPEKTTIDISSVAANSPNVKIRFQFWSPASYNGPANGGPGCCYSWMIDDVSIGPPANTISGQVFLDQNNNNQWDVGEVFIPNYPVIIDFTTAFTNQFGYYELEVLGNEIQVYTGQLLPETASFPSSATITYTQEYGQANTQDFAITYSGNSSNLRVEAYSVNPLVPGFEYGNFAIVTNEGFLPASMDFEASIPQQTSFVQVMPQNLISQTDTSVSFETGMIPPFASYTAYYATLLVDQPPLVQMNDVLQFDFQLSNVSVTETNSDDNTFTLFETAVSSYDPNDIIMLKGSSQTPDFINSGEYFTYRIRFQNSGNFPTSFISIEDTLSELLDWSTFKPVATSHPTQVSIDNNGNVRYFFPEIQLLPEEQNEALSMGYIIYKIKPLSTVALGDIITNQAFIYFDFNPAIITNEDTVRIEIPLDNKMTASQEFITLYPNPTSGNLNIKFNSETYELSNNDIFSIFNSQGTLVYSGKLSEIKNGISTAEYISGLYALHLQTKQGNFKSSFVVRKE
jgi:hypothetical protein